MDLGRLTGHLTRRGGLKGAAAVAGAALLPAGGGHAVQAVQPDLLESLAITVPRAANRQVIFTNKVSAVWLTQTHANDHPEHAWFAGLNVAKKKVTGDYSVWVGASALDRTQAEVTVWPDRMERSHAGGITETLRFAEGRVLVEITLSGAPAEADIRLSGDGVRLSGSRDGVRFYQPGDGAPGVLGLARQGDSFLIALEDDEAAVIAALADGFATAAALHGAQRARLNGLISGDHLFECSDADIEKAVRWMTLTMDRLVMDQGEKPGIYAGLPWFNEYWGRDSFIALPGALLVTGQFETARKILVSFAQYMDMEETSRFYGRVPNIVQPDKLDYHSADGTPRWVLAVKAYVDWSGDSSIVEELWPQLVASVEGALKNWVDEDGFLTHADNETWMDARRQPDLKPYSPRGNRANDVQALWAGQLSAVGLMAVGQEDGRIAERATAALNRVRIGFAQKFLQRHTGMMADRLDASGRADWTVRPNALMALDLVDDPRPAAQITRRVMEQSVFPWGVASIGQNETCFHPYHRADSLWHKDEAYHNGAVWQWLNGPAMDALLAGGHGGLAGELFRWQCADLLARGCVGGLAENSDAHLKPGSARPELTGTCLQAWSNSEHLRVLVEGFLGLKPRIATGLLHLGIAPGGIAAEIGLAVRVGGVRFRVERFTHDDGVSRWIWSFASSPPPVSVESAAQGQSVLVSGLGAGDMIQALVDPRGALTSVTVVRAGSRVESVPVPPIASGTAQASQVLAGTGFAHPLDRQWPAMTGQCRSGIGP